MHMNPTLVRGDMRYWRMQPDERLRPWVICYFLVEPTGQIPPNERPPPGSQQQLLLPDGYSEIVFKLDAAFERWAIGHPDERAVMSSSYLIGGRSHSVLTRNLGAVRLAGAKLDSRLLRAVIGIPLNEFRDSTRRMSDRVNDHGIGGPPVGEAPSLRTRSTDMGRSTDNGRSCR